MAQVFNIFHNNFFERPVLPNWSWEIAIIGNQNEGWTEEQMSIFSQAVTKIEIPELQMLTTQSQFRGLTFDIPTRLENTGELSLTFNENTNMELYKALKDKLYYASYNDGYVIDEWSKQNDKGEYEDTYMLYYAPFDVYVKLLDPMTYEPVYHFIFRNCFISNIGEVELSYDSEEVYTYEVKIHYNFRFEGLDAEDYYKHITSSSKSNEDKIPDAPAGAKDGVGDYNGPEMTDVSQVKQNTTEDKSAIQQSKTDGLASPQEKASLEARKAMSGYRPNTSRI